MARRYRGSGGRGLGWPLGRSSPHIWLRRRRMGIGLVIAAVVVLAGYDRISRREEPPAAPVAIDQRDDISRYNDQTFRVTQAVDGDTLHIDLPDKTKAYTIIRLWGVDTPEVHGVARPAYFGPEASRFTHAACDGKQVRIELVPGRTRDRYGRLLAYVHLPDGSMLNQRLVAEGYAYADTRFPHKWRAKFVQLEQQARQDKAGLWAGVTPEDMPNWRRKRETPARGTDSGAMLPNRRNGGTFLLATTLCL